jgi:cupin
MAPVPWRRRAAAPEGSWRGLLAIGSFQRREARGREAGLGGVAAHRSAAYEQKQEQPQAGAWTCPGFVEGCGLGIRVSGLTAFCPPVWWHSFSIPAGVEGDLHIQVEGEEESLVIGAGEVVLLPRNDQHLMGSDLSLPPVPGGEIIHPPKDGGLFSIHHGGGGRCTRLVCGFLGCASAECNPVISSLLPLLKLNIEQGGAAEWIRSTFQYAAEEVSAGRPGSETVLAKLSELLFVEAVRRYAEALPDGQTGWLAGLREPYVARALALLHRDITRRWTVDDLGREVGLSRS